VSHDVLLSPPTAGSTVAAKQGKRCRSRQYSSTNIPELHIGAAYWAVGTSLFDKTGSFVVTSQGYVCAMHENMEFPGGGRRRSQQWPGHHGLRAIG
jgi:hypothetical protein